MIGSLCLCCTTTPVYNHRYVTTFRPLSYNYSLFLAEALLQYMYIVHCTLYSVYAEENGKEDTESNILVRKYL